MLRPGCPRRRMRRNPHYEEDDADPDAETLFYCSKCSMPFPQSGCSKPRWKSRVQHGAVSLTCRAKKRATAFSEATRSRGKGRALKCARCEKAPAQEQECALCKTTKTKAGFP